MATFISLINLTDQGIRNVKDSPERYEAFQAMAEKLGVKVKSVYYTVGHYDMVVILEGSDEAATSALLKVSVYFAKAARRSHPHNSAVFDIDGVREKQVAHSLVSCDPILLRRSTARRLSISALRQADR